MDGGGHTGPAEQVPGFGGINADLAAVRNEDIKGDASLDNDIEKVLTVAFPKKKFSCTHMHQMSNVCYLLQVLGLDLLKPWNFLKFRGHLCFVVHVVLLMYGE